MARTVLLRGMLVGLAAGLLAFGFAWLVGEPQVRSAIAVEAQALAAAGRQPAPALVGRGVQSTAGLATAVGVYGVALGGLFGLAFALAYGRIGRFGPRATAALLALGGFVAVELVPFLKYPATPPGATGADTIGHRTGLYFAMLLLSLVAALTAVSLGRRVAPRLGNWNATLLATGAYVALVAVTQLALPAVDEVPPGFPATLLWRFRLASLGTQAVLWATFGLLFGALTERGLRRAARPRTLQLHR
jgi:Probable cobalt transporter subunit (CbtA)